jgi:hypothetical protein
MRLAPALLISLLAAGAATAATEITRRVAPVSTVFTDAKDRYVVSVWRDPDTGCEYLISGDHIIPRLERDGRPRCPT